MLPSSALRLKLIPQLMVHDFATPWKIHNHNNFGNPAKATALMVHWDVRPVWRVLAVSTFKLLGILFCLISLATLLAWFMLRRFTSKSKSSPAVGEQINPPSLPERKTEVPRQHRRRHDNLAPEDVELPPKPRLNPWRCFKPTSGEYSALQTPANAATVTFEKMCKLLMGLCGATVVILGLVVILVWLNNQAGWILLRFDGSIMRFNSAVLLVVAGISLLTLTFNQFMWMRLGGAVLVVIGTATLLQFPLQIDFGIAELFFKHRYTETALAVNRMSMNSAACFILLGLAFITLRAPGSQIWRFFVTALLSSAVLSIATIALLAHAASVPAAQWWDASHRMQLPTACSFTVCAIWLLIHAARSYRQSGGALLQFFPLIVGNAAIFATVVLWQEMTYQDNERVSEKVQIQFDTLRSVLNAELRNHEQALLRMADRWNQAGGTTQAAWRDDARHYLDGLRGFETLVWVDANDQLRWIVPSEDHLQSLALNKGSQGRAAIKEAEFRHSAVTITWTSDPAEHPKVWLCQPLWRNATYDGCLVAVFNLPQLMLQIAREIHLDGQLLSVRDGQNTLFESRRKTDDTEPLFTQTAELAIANSTWTLTDVPARQWVTQQHGWLSETVLGAGLLFSLLSTATLQLAVWARENYRQAAASHARLIAEIEERLLAERRQHASERRLSDAFDQAPIGMVILAPNGEFLRVNPAYCQIVGYSDAELLGMTVHQLTHSDDIVRNQEAMSSLSRGETHSYQIEQRYIRSDGQTAHVLLFATFMSRVEDGCPHFFCQIQDVTTQRLVQQQLRDSEAKARAILETAIDAIVSVDQDGIVASANPAAEHMFGYSAQEFAGRHVSEFMPDLDTPGRAASKSPKLNGEAAKVNGARREVFGRRGDGSTFPLELSMSQLSNGHPRMFTCIAHDITRRKADEQIRARLAAAVDYAGDAIISTDLHGAILTWNRAAENIFGHQAENIIGQSMMILIPQELHHEESQIIEQIISGKPFEHYESIRLRKNGDRLNVQLTISPIVDSQQQVIGASMIICDVTERKRAEEELRQAKEAAESANRAKAEFLANMSHEIRTPMNGIIGMTEVSLASQLTPDQRDSLETIQDSAKALLSVVNDILDYSKIDAGKMDLVSVRFNLSNKVDNAMRNLAVKAAQQGLKLRYDIDSSVPPWIVGDPDRLRQVMINLVGNALKFTSQGEVVVRVQNHDEIAADDKHCVLHFSVTDTGVGIPPEKHGLIFEAFAQGDSSTTRRYGGTGLGLSISARLVELMGGQIWVESELGKGSTFHFTARFGISCLDPNQTCNNNLTELANLRGRNQLTMENTTEFDHLAVLPPCNVPRHLNILLADDNPINQKVTRRMLNQDGQRVAVANNGKEAISALQQGGFDLVLMDVQMPEMDGFEATAAIRASEQISGKHIPIVAMTAHAMNGDRERCLAVGMDAYISKPFQLEELRQAIVSVFPSPEARIENPPLDYAAALAAVNGDAQFLLDLASILAEDVPLRMNEIQKSLAVGDAKAVEKTSHRLKGSFIPFFAQEAIALAQALETAGGLGDSTRATEIFGNLRREVDLLLAQLAAMAAEQNINHESNSKTPSIPPDEIPCTL